MDSSVISNSVASKFRGCLTGVLLGDCLGHRFEYRHISKRILRDFITDLLSGESGKIFYCSDDTSMTFSVASSLIEKKQINVKDMAQRFVAEYYSHPIRGYGPNAIDVFKDLYHTDFEDVFLPAKQQFGGSGSYANGAATRISPIALFGSTKGEEFIIKSAKKCARITHAHEIGYNGAILQSLAVNAALKLDASQDLDPVHFIDGLHKRMQNIEIKDKIKPYCESLEKIKAIFTERQEHISSKKIADYLGNDVCALRSVPTAIYSFLRGTKPLKDYECRGWKRFFPLPCGANKQPSNPFIRTLYFAMSVGGDTGTITSMAGSIAGAYYGMDLLPNTLLKRCELFEEMLVLADKLFDVTQEYAPVLPGRFL